MMRIDHDFHLHTRLSSCSGDPRQTAERLLQYALENGLKKLCVTDHFWDETVPGASNWYASQNFEHIRQILPLPESEQVKLFFGCETELDKHFRLGIAPQTMEKLDFIIIPTTHLHMSGFTIDTERDGSREARARLWAERLDAVLSMPLPFHKIGIAHLTCPLMAKDPQGEYLRVLDLIPDGVMRDLFSRAAACGVGIELNFDPIMPSRDELPRVLRPYRIAKEEGCKFYFGTDAHHPSSLHTVRANRIVQLLALEEEDAFTLPEVSVTDFGT